MAFCFVVGTIAKYKILFSAFVGSKLHDHNAVRIGYEVFPLILYPVFVKLHYSHRRIQRQDAAVIAHIDFAESGFHIKLSHRGKSAEAERSLVFFFISSQPVEVFLGEIPRFFRISVQESLPDFFQYACRLFVYIPIIFGAFGSIRSTFPKRLFIQCDSFRRYGAHDIRSQAAIPDRQRTAFPCFVRIRPCAVGT